MEMNTDKAKVLNDDRGADFVQIRLGRPRRWGATRWTRGQGFERRLKVMSVGRKGRLSGSTPLGARSAARSEDTAEPALPGRWCCPR